MSIKILIHLLMDAPVYMGTLCTTVGGSGVGTGSGPGVALLADRAVQRLTEVLTALYRCIMCLLSYTFSAHTYKRRAMDHVLSPLIREMDWVIMKRRVWNLM